MMIEVYSKPQCVQCNQTKKALEKQGVGYTEFNVMEDESAFKFVTEDLGHRAAPVVVVKDSSGNVLKSWAGFQPELISELK